MAACDGVTYPFDRLLLATGAEPVHLPLPGADRPHVQYLRSLADSRALVAKAKTAKRAVVIGASFIGLEVAASLVARFIQDDRHAAIPRSEFVARSWKLALAKAKQLGWIE